MINFVPWPRVDSTTIYPWWPFMPRLPCRSSWMFILRFQ